MVKIYSQNSSEKPSSDSPNKILLLFHLYKKDFTAYMLKNHSIDEDTVADIYQESFMVLFQDIRSGKLQDLKSTTLKNYLFSVGIKKAMKYFEQQRKLPKTDIQDYLELIEIDNSIEWEEKQEIVRKVISEMEELCQKVLNLYYWEQKSMKEIAQEMSYKDEQGAKNRKNICMKKLKERLKNIFRKEGWI